MIHFLPLIISLIFILGSLRLELNVHPMLMQVNANKIGR